MAAEHNLDLAQIAGTGLGGRVTKKDVTAYLQRGAEHAAGDAGVADLDGEALAAQVLGRQATPMGSSSSRVRVSTLRRLH